MNSLAQNIWTALRNPYILRSYAPWQFARMTGRTPLLDIQGVKIGGFPNFSAYLGTLRGRPTEEELGFLTPLIQKDKVVFDVGANFGVFAILFAKLSPRARIYAFEPNSTTAAELRKNLALNRIDNVVVVEKAVGSQNGHVRFTDSSDPATNRILEGDSEGIEVPVCTLDSFCHENGIGQIDFLKIDVEGAELMALKGTQDLFSRQAVVAGMIEVCPDNLKMFNLSIADVTEFFEEMGYDLSLLGGGPKASIDDTVVLDNASFIRAER